MEEGLEIKDNLHGASQAFIYNIITNGNEQQAREIHDRDLRKEFTFRPFYFENTLRDNKNPSSMYIKKGTRAILEVITHTDDFFRLFIQGAVEQKAAGSFLNFMNHKMLIVETQVSHGFDMIPLTDETGSPERLALDVKTPMWFRLQHPKSNLELKAQGYKTKEKNVRFPNPILIYRSLRDQILNYTGYEHLIPTPEEFINSVFCDKVVYFHSKVERTKRDANIFEQHEGFVGKLLLFVDGASELRNKIYNFLRLGTYFGAGARTSLGFGQFEIEPKPFKSLIPPSEAQNLSNQDSLSNNLSE